MYNPTPIKIRNSARMLHPELFYTQMKKLLHRKQTDRFVFDGSTRIAALRRFFLIMPDSVYMIEKPKENENLNLYLLNENKNYKIKKYKLKTFHKDEPNI